MNNNIFSDFYLYTDENMFEPLNNKNKIIYNYITKELGQENLYRYRILVKTENIQYKCKDSNIVLCSNLEKLLNENKDFRKTIEKEVNKYFGSRKLLFFTRNEHIIIITSRTIY